MQLNPLRSLVTAEEMFSLCGIDHVTLSAAGLALLQSTPLDAHFEGIRDRSLQYLNDGSHYDEKDSFFSTDFEASLEDPILQALQVDTLAHFGAAEVALRAIAKEHLRKM